MVTIGSWAEQFVGLCCKEANKNTFLKHRMVRATEIHPPQMQYNFFKILNTEGSKRLEAIRWFTGLPLRCLGQFNGRKFKILS